MSNTRHKNINFNLGTADNGYSWNQVQMALLMDIRDELQQLNRTFNCQYFLTMPHNLDRLRKAAEGIRRDKKAPKK